MGRTVFRWGKLKESRVGIGAISRLVRDACILVQSTSRDVGLGVWQSNAYNGWRAISSSLVALSWVQWRCILLHSI